MSEKEHQINELQRKLDFLIKRQNEFILEIRAIREELTLLQSGKVQQKSQTTAQSKPIVQAEKTEKIVSQSITQKPLEQKPIEQAASAFPTESFQNKIKTKSNLEKFIGENLINKIGIAILIIGVGIGAKYSIDHQLISPLTRIIVGYLVGLGLLAFGIRLKKKYENFSAVLVSGSIAVLYFITYAGYGFYNLFPQTFAFVLMVIFTLFTVVAALNYNKQIIAHIGLVGAYAVPFLLSDGSGRVAILFTYMAIINGGILVLAFKKYWKALYYVSFGLTWLIFGGWFIASFSVSAHFTLALAFLCVFFATFYSIFIAYKLLKKEMFAPTDIIMLFLNSSIFYGLGCSILSYHQIGNQLLGLFTLMNAVIHFGVAVIIFKQKLADRNLFYLIIGLVLTFITIAVPVQLDGNWVTLIWACEAAVMIWLARKNSVSVYESLAYILVLISFFSLCHDWALSWRGDFSSKYNLITALLVAAIFGFITFWHSKKTEDSVTTIKPLTFLMSYIIPSIMVFVIYNAFRLEIVAYFYHLHEKSLVEIPFGDGLSLDHYYNDNLLIFRNVWIINYSITFLVLLSFINIKWFKNKFFGIANLGLNAVILLTFLLVGFSLLSRLVHNYSYPMHPEFYDVSFFNITIRYISYALIILLLFSKYAYLKQKFLEPILPLVRVIFDMTLLVTICWILSQELTTWLNMAHVAKSDKLGLSIFWGIYSLAIIVIGIWKKKKHFRIGSMIFFGITLIKLFFYDLVHLNTISKTIVFVSLGVLLLIISFIYNKYKHLISDEK